MNSAGRWRNVTLKDVCHRITDGTHQPPRFELEGVPFLVIGNVAGGTIDWGGVTKWVSRQTYEKLTAQCRPERGDVLYTAVGSYGTAIPVETDRSFVFQRHIAHIKPNRALIQPRFLAHMLNGPDLRAVADAVARGVAQKTVTLGHLREFEILLPSLDEQSRVAAILDKADAIRRKRKEAIALTEELLRSAFLEMFGDPVTNPKGWPVCSVGDVVSEVRDGPHVSPQYAEKGIPFLSTRNIRPGRLLLDDLRYVSQEGYEELTRRFRPQVGDVLLTKGGTTGLAKVVDFDWPFAVWVHLAVLRPKGNIRPEFLESALNSEYGYKQSQHFTRGIANRDLGLTRIVQIRFPLPPLEVQDRYVAFARGLRGFQRRQEGALSSADALFASLLHRAFRGELTGSVSPKD